MPGIEPRIEPWEGVPQGKEKEMDVNYVFLCGVMWCRYGLHDAGSELVRAASSRDPDLSALALALLAKGCKTLQQFPKDEEGREFSEKTPGEGASPSTDLYSYLN